MDVKLDTKETFTVVRPLDSNISENMAEDFAKLLHDLQKKTPPHVILDLEKVSTIDPEIAEIIVNNFTTYLEEGNSFVCCNIQPQLLLMLEQMEILDLLNVTPTESEAWDIIHMEEIERELLNGENDEA